MKTLSAICFVVLTLCAHPLFACSKDDYGKCGEQPPATDRYDSPKDDKKKGEDDKKEEGKKEPAKDSGGASKGDKGKSGSEGGQQ